MSEDKCFENGCDKTDTTYVDATCGPLGDFRYYCPEHLEKFRVKQKIRSKERSIVFINSEIVAANNTISKLTKELAEEMKVLHKLITNRDN